MVSESECYQVDVADLLAPSLMGIYLWAESPLLNLTLILTVTRGSLVLHGVKNNESSYAQHMLRKAALFEVQYSTVRLTFVELL